VLFAFDPGARGKIPVELFREAAEKYGYIVAGSNNSRNGPFERSIEAADAMMQDVSHRFALDLRRLYTTGFSGGARVATLVAQICKDCAAGVFAHGAGFPSSRAPTEKTSFVYFASIGDLDLNYYELVELEPTLDALNVPNRLRRFSGTHQWAPPDVCMEGIEWFELMAMKQGRREKDPAWVAEQFALATRKVRELDKAGDAYALWRELRKLAPEFDGLADTSAWARRAAELKDSVAVREGARRERAAVDEQRSIVTPINNLLDALPAEPRMRAAARAEISSQIAALLDQLKRYKEGEKSIVLRRAHSELVGHAFEAGQENLRLKNFAQAVADFEVAAELLPDSPRPFLALARAHAQSGKKKETLRALQKALEKGTSRESLAAFLRENEEFAAYLNQPEFQAWLSAAPQKP
jgi:tetratricopeptide (TPR) repeat protein